RLVGRGEDRERARALDRRDEARRLDGGDQRRVVLRVDGVVDDVLARVHRRAADHDLRKRRDGGGGEDRGERDGGELDDLHGCPSWWWGDGACFQGASTSGSSFYAPCGVMDSRPADA